MYGAEDVLPLTSFGTHYCFSQRWEDQKDISQAFECPHGECTRKFKNLKNLCGYMKKKHNFFYRKNKIKEANNKSSPLDSTSQKMNSKIVGDVEKRLRKIYSQQVQAWRQMTLAL